jgi:hypothetical protein
VGIEFSQVASPNADGNINLLYGVAANSPSDAWAVGMFWPNSGGLENTLIQRWNGTVWTTIPSPNPSTRSGLRGVDVVSANDAWAVGQYQDFNIYKFRPMILRWNGTAWNQVPINMDEGSDHIYLHSVAVVDANQAWAVGRRANSPNNATLVLRWDGTEWMEDLSGRIVAPAYSVNAPSFNAVAAAGPNDVWAVGTIHENGRLETLTAHWDGTTWTRIASPNADDISTNTLRGVAAISSNDVWAVGSFFDYSRGGYSTLTMHWNGTQWTIIPSPNATGAGNPSGLSPSDRDGNTTPDGQGPPQDGDGDSLYGVSAFAPDEVWAVGISDAIEPGEDGVVNTLALRWNGAEWTQVASASPSDDYSVLYAVDAIAVGDAWTVGATGAFVQSTYNYFTLIERSNGVSCSGPTATPTAVGPSATPTVCGVSQALSEGFEHRGTLGAQFVASVATCVPGGCGWHADADVQHSGAYSASAPARPGTSDQRLTTSSSIAIPANSIAASLSFWHMEQFTSGDGGVLEVSTNGGANWADAGANITQGGYNTMLGGPSNPLTGRQGWGGYVPDGMFNQVTVNLLPYAGQGVQFRFRLGTDNSIGTRGWAIDDVTVTITGPCVPGTPASPTNTSVSGTPPPVMTSTPRPSSTATATPTCGPTWTRVASPPGGPGNTSLNDVVAIATDDVWAVGYAGIILHWNGTSWAEVSNPGEGDGNELTGVDAISSNDVWAVGYQNTTGFTQPLTLHWNGTSWSLVPSPGTPGMHSSLQGVGAVATNDVWAVGDTIDGPMIMHWDGAAWSVVPNAGGGAAMQNRYIPAQNGGPGLYYSSLFDVGVVSANDVWAGGTRNGVTWILHWNGTQWAQVPAPNPSTENTINALTVIGPNDIWAVGHKGFYLEPEGGSALHWDGSQWSSVSVPPGNYGLFGVTSVSPNEVWAVGIEDIGQYSYDAVILKWNGSSWTRTPSPNPTFSDRDELYGIDAAGPGDMWAVGMFDFETLTDRYYSPPCGTPAPTYTPVPSSPTPTGTPVVEPTNPPIPPTSTPIVEPTNTPLTEATNTPVAETTDTPVAGPTDTPIAVSTDTPVAPTSTPIEPESCQIHFSDMPQGSTFYTYAYCLACRGVISGYADGTFRPNDNVTRGQLAKLLSNAGRMQPGNTQAQTFQDVPPTHTFHKYIESMADAGIIGGYACGGQGEPCVAPGNKPYFRPGANATRGQISKMVASAAGIREAAEAGQMFQDVPQSSTFYAWVQMLGSHGMMSGYPCGEQGEPCGQSNMPYFRPSNNTTRGQAAKIVANAFYPECSTAPGR